MSRRGIEKIVKKSSAWAKHGKHAKIDPALLNPIRPTRIQEWKASIKELFKKK